MTDTSPTEQTVQVPPAPPDWDTLLDTIPPEYLFKHRRVGGIVGSHIQQQVEHKTKQDKENAQNDAIRKQEQEMLQLAQTNPFEFANKWLGGKSEEIAKREFSELSAKAQREMLDALGTAYGEIPEWRELTQEEFAEVAQKTNGLSGASLIAAFNTAAFDKVADKRASKRVQSELSERMKKEREAWEREAQAARLRSETVPPMTASNGAARFDPWSLSDKEFNEWYERDVLR